MTTQADFTDAEWELILEGPTEAGKMVIAAERGGTFRESFSMSKAYAEARGQHGESELLDVIVTSKPKVDRTRHSSFDDLKEHALQQVRDAIAALEGKATPEEVDDYRRFVLGARPARRRGARGGRQARERCRGGRDRPHRRRARGARDLRTPRRAELQRTIRRVVRACPPASPPALGFAVRR